VSEPLVTAVVTAYACAAFVGEALDSALAQALPGGGALEVVVVDDGSTDGTAAEIAVRAAREPQRVRVIRQANAGYIGATETGIRAARGALVALLDGDDAWPAGKLAAQVALLAARPEVGLVYGDMRVIDAHGVELQPSWLEDDAPPQGRDVIGLLAGNHATSSSIVLRTALARELIPIPAGIAFADWWFAVRAAQEAAVAYVPEPRTLYRHHGANMSLGTSGAARAGQLRAALALQRWFLRRLAPGTGAPAALLGAWRTFEAFGAELQSVAGTPFTATVPVTPGDRAAAAASLRAAGAARAAGDDEAAALAFLHAAAADPWSRPARAGLATVGGA
jgi:hypothetical protein